MISHGPATAAAVAILINTRLNKLQNLNEIKQLK